ncbi:glycoside hydrolase family 3 C-terminal domain-containing protein [Occallatibacter riparius]|uniref:beta-glucosidase n=1 Tax=Occallatibacter riparius TaxID=1002689 RepID=A0A9J7BSH5_9BACT|nr:glycoside hydrolase family 3 C-terminal domain-containing protein [Occallatibacter riparius]UWZ85828.1 glycoside hydrolase family 3 C-terminal domain-containing protein [Occallatibacter riparius]
MPGETVLCSPVQSKPVRSTQRAVVSLAHCGFNAARRAVLPLTLLLAAASGTPAHAAQAADDKPAYFDRTLPIDARVDDLIKRMTLKEKIGQLNLPCVYVDQLGTTVDEKAEQVRKFAAGTQTEEIGPGAGFFTLADTLKQKDLEWQVNYFNELQKIATTQTRLKIPLLQDEEGTHGAMFPNATVFPEGLAVGSTFDMPLVQRIYAASAEEARAIGIHVLSTLVAELDRDPRMGRNMEAYTEDPYLYAQIMKNIVRGAQGSDIAAPDKVVALLTDFPTQSESASGMERGAVEVSERSLRENYLVPWVSGFNAGALGVMAGYPEIEDVPEHSSEKWNTQVLRNELGFKGILVSEGNGFDSIVYENVAPDQKQAGAMGLRAGVDLNITYEPAYMGPMVQMVQNGEVPEWLIDRAVRRVLELKFRLGLFENPFTDLEHAKKVMHSQEHQELTLQAAREGIVLLKNDGNLLPLRKQVKTIAVIGPDADDAWSQLGDYSPSAVPYKMTSILDGIKQKLGAQSGVLYAHGCDVIGGKKDFAEAVAAARKAEVAVVVVGERPDNAGERKLGMSTDGEAYDVASFDLTGYQEELVQAIQATGTPVVLVLVNGRPLSIRWEAEHIPAIVEAWEPGERGGEAVADVLFGDYNPTGRLAITIPRSSGQLPVFYNHKPSKAYWIKHAWSKDGGYVDMPGTPLYPFGYGLSYTSFKYSNLRVSSGEISEGGQVNVTVDVENNGHRAGTQLVQLYLHEHYAPVSLPVEQLRAFERVDLQPGEKKTVKMTLRPEDLMLLDRDMLWRVSPGTFDVLIGNSSADIALRASFEVKQPSGPLAGRGFSTQPDLAR